MKNKELNLARLSQAADFLHDVLRDLDRSTRACRCCGIPVQQNRFEFESHRRLSAALKRVHAVSTLMRSNATSYKDLDSGG